MSVLNLLAHDSLVAPVVYCHKHQLALSPNAP